MSVVTLSAKPCIVRPRASRTPIAPILRGSGPDGTDPHAREPREPAGVGHTELAERVDEQLLDVRTWAIGPIAFGSERIG